jgi:hypothetical protein
MNLIRARLNNTEQQTRQLLHQAGLSDGLLMLMLMLMIQIKTNII